MTTFSLSPEPRAASSSAQTIYVVGAFDDAFAMPMAAMVRSALDTLRAGWRIDLTILDGGVKAASRRRMERSWAGAPITARWRPFDASRTADLPDPGPWGPVVYQRLLLPEFLPEEVDKVLYLDCDLIVERDLVQLWEQDVDGRLLLAAQDLYMPFFASEAHPAEAVGAFRPFPRRTPVSNHAALGLAADSPYFNSGVMLLNLAAWRREDVSRRLVDCLQSNRRHVAFADQYALNVVCAGRWGRLDPRWNRSSALLAHGAETREDLLLPPEGWDAVLADPWIRHYSIQPKPWVWGYPWPDRDAFFAALDRTDWAGWRPRRTWGQWWERRTKALRRRVAGRAAAPTS